MRAYAQGTLSDGVLAYPACYSHVQTDTRGVCGYRHMEYESVTKDTRMHMRPFLGEGLYQCFFFLLILTLN